MLVESEMEARITSHGEEIPAIRSNLIISIDIFCGLQTEIEADTRLQSNKIQWPTIDAEI